MSLLITTRRNRKQTKDLIETSVAHSAAAVFKFPSCRWRQPVASHTCLVGAIVTGARRSASAGMRTPCVRTFCLVGSEEEPPHGGELSPRRLAAPPAPAVLSPRRLRALLANRIMVSHCHYV